MKKLLFLFLLLPFLGNSQATFTAPVGYNTGAPTATPSGVGTRWRFDLLTGKKYTWLPGSSSWDEDARGIDQVAGCSAPLYTPGYNQSTFAVNSCTVPELYQWTGAAWVRLNEGEVYTAGTGISISGGNEISNTAPDQTVTMTDGTGIDVTGTYPNFTVTNTSPNVVQTLSIAGQDLTLSGGGGTVAIPAGSSLGTGFTAGGGTGTIPAGTVAAVDVYAGWGDNQAQFIYDIPSYIQSLADNFRGFGFQVFNETTGDAYFAGSTEEDPTAFIVSTLSGSGPGTFSINPTTANLLPAEILQIGAGTQTNVISPLVNFTGVARLGRFTTTQRNAIASPATGYTIYNTDATATDSSTGVMQVWNGSVWKNAW